MIANSTPVLAAAGAKVSPPVGVTELRTLVTVRAVSGQILQVQARAPQAGYAEQLANAVASSYVTYSVSWRRPRRGLRWPRCSSNPPSSPSRSMICKPRSTRVSARIAAEASGSSAGLQDANLLTSLQSEQSQLSQELNSVTSQISAAQLASSSAASTTRILQTAATVPADTYGLAVTAGITGFIVGCIDAPLSSFVRVQRDPRLRLRDEIAQAVGAPVIASIEAPSCTTATSGESFSRAGRAPPQSGRSGTCCTPS